MKAGEASNCAFCKIIRGESECFAVFENEISIAFLDQRPLFPGHCLLIPKEHYSTLNEFPAALLGPMFAGAQLIARALEEGLLAEGTFVALNNRVSQSVPHLHIHVVPRKKNDGLKGFFWPRQPYRDHDHLVNVQKSLRAAIAEILETQKRTNG